jgi:hypothetical protein
LAWLREDLLLFEFLECPDPHAVSHATSRDSSGFDRLEQFLPRGTILDGPTHVGNHTILETPRRQDPQHTQFLHFDGQRAVLAHTEAPDFRPGGGVIWVKLCGPVHLAIAIGIGEVI